MVKRITVPDLLFPDDAALVAHSAQVLEKLLNKFLSACSDFDLIISLKKAKLLSQGKYIPPIIKIDDMYIKNLENFVYLGSSIASSTSTDTKINFCIDKASGTFA